MKTIIFDLGGVLVDWNPEYVYLKEFKGDRRKMKWFFDNVCTSSWNEEQDGGKLMKEATEERIKLFPDYERLIRMFYGRWEEMLKDEISGTVEILYKLKNDKRAYHLLDAVGTKPNVVYQVKIRNDKKMSFKKYCAFINFI